MLGLAYQSFNSDNDNSSNNDINGNINKDSDTFRGIKYYMIINIT